MRYEHANTVWTSSRRLTRGLAYNIVVTLVVYYLSAYLLNRVFGRPHRRVRTALSQRCPAFVRP